MHGKQFSSLLIAGLLWIAPASANALSLNVIGGSVDLASGCDSVFCLGPPAFELGLGGTASGTIDTDGATIAIALEIPMWSLDEAGGPGTIVFEDVSYTASIAHNGSLTDFNGAGLGTVTATSPALNLMNVGINVDCEETAPATYKCGVVIAGPTFPIPGPSGTLYVPHTIDLTATAVPEPALGVMGLTVGLAGFAYAGRRREWN